MQFIRGPARKNSDWFGCDGGRQIHYFYYNFIRKHPTIKTTPAVMVGVADKAWTMLDFVALLEREEALLGE